MSGEPIEKVEADPKAGTYAHFDKIEKQNKKYKKTIKEAKGKIRFNMIEETMWFEDSTGSIEEWYGNLGDSYPEVKTLTRFMDKVREYEAFLRSYNYDILYGNDLTYQELIWVMIKVMDNEIIEYSFPKEEVGK